MIKVIATDLDGTLFYPREVRTMIPKANIELLKKFKDDGGRIVLVSGRSYFYAEKVIERLGFMVDSICCNAAVIHHGGELLEEHFLPINFPEILKEIEESFLVRGQAIMSKDVPVVMRVTRRSHFKNFFLRLFYATQGVYKEKIVMNPDVWDEELNKGQIYKFMLYFGSGKKSKRRAEAANEYLNKKYPMLTTAFTSGSIEITAKNASKAEGLAKYCQMYGINADEVIVCGDSGNDISMFQAFPTHSFVMKHAWPSVKKHARHEIRRVSELGPYIESINVDCEE